MALELYGRKDSINVQKVMWLLAELGTDYTHIEKGGSFGGLDDEDFKQMTPFGLVPVLKDGDFTVSESNAILRYLAQTQPGGEAFYPADPQIRATIDMWMDFGSQSLYPEFIKIFSQIVRTPPKDRKMNVVSIATRRFQVCTRLIGGLLEDRPWIAGNNLTLADMATGVYMFRFTTLPVIKRVEQGRVQAWAVRMQGRKAYMDTVGADYRHMFVVPL